MESKIPCTQQVQPILIGEIMPKVIQIEPVFLPVFKDIKIDNKPGISSHQQRMGIKGLEKWYFYFKGQEMKSTEIFQGEKFSSEGKNKYISDMKLIFLQTAHGLL